MVDILFARTFSIVGGMIIITAITSRINKAFETAIEMWITMIGTFAFLLAIFLFADLYPLNLFLVAAFSALIGWQIAPSIEYFGKSHKRRKFCKSRGIVIGKGQKMTDHQKQAFEQSFDANQYYQGWRNVVFQAFLATALAVFSSAGVAFLTNLDIGFLGSILLFSLLVLFVMGLLNLFFHSRIYTLIKAYLGAVIFTLYLLYDFDRLKKMAGDESWRTAIDIAVNIYLDIINLFLMLLEILGGSSD